MYPNQGAVNEIVLANDPKRAAVERAYAKLGIRNIDSYILNEKVLIVEIPLVAGLNSYESILQESNNGRPLEVKLNRNDIFIATHIGVAVRKQSAGAHGNYRDFTFADGNYFIGAAGGKTEAFCLQPIWNARMYLNANNIDVIDGIPTDKMEYIPERGTIIASGDQVADELPMSSRDLETRGFFRLPTTPILNGQLDNKIKLSNIVGDTTLIAGGIDGAGAALTTSNVLRLMVHGFEVAGAATATLAYMKQY